MQHEMWMVEAIIQREITSTVKITDAQVQEFYTTGTDLIVRLLQADLDKMLKDPAAPPALIGKVKDRIAEVKKANLARLEQPERVKVSHIFMSTIDRQTEEPIPEEQTTQYVTATGVPAMTSLTTWWYESIPTA